MNPTKGHVMNSRDGYEIAYTHHGEYQVWVDGTFLDSTEDYDAACTMRLQAIQYDAMDKARSWIGAALAR